MVILGHGLTYSRLTHVPFSEGASEGMAGNNGTRWVGSKVADIMFSKVKYIIIQLARGSRGPQSGGWGVCGGSLLATVASKRVMGI